ncbi:hypothetical protein [Alteromonas antoniana]|uniref:hypothetical protein n=1 Tax=Alteromonas antoniana TaxID=2803813 RepID=UPI001C47E11A|nr:hypothetical protein [Alteromonas antoniana]
MKDNKLVNIDNASENVDSKQLNEYMVIVEELGEAQEYRVTSRHQLDDMDESEMLKLLGQKIQFGSEADLSLYSLSTMQVVEV